MGQKCMSTDVEFKEGDTRRVIEVEILYDAVREMREAFTVHLKPDENMVAEIQVWETRMNIPWKFYSLCGTS